MTEILLIEDEPSVAAFVKQGLEEEGFKVEHVSDGQLALDSVQQQKFDLILLDILLPKINGLEVCRRIREDKLSKAPILMLTALSTPENAALGLDSGADDYLAKPFKLIELKARIRSLLRRTENAESNLEEVQPLQQIYTYADIEINDATKKVYRDKQEVSLTSTEYKLLLTFLKNPDIVLSRHTLLEEVWGINFEIGTNVVDVYVNYLRKKLNLAQANKYIQTVIGMGYVLRKST